MVNLKTNYLGLTLKSPLVVSSSRLTSSAGNIVEAENSGAGAVVLKSLFEEQIMHYAGVLALGGNYPEADDYISSYTRSHSVGEYLRLIESAKKSVTIPVIPSINCYSSKSWIDFARNIADAGADALEVNVFILPTDRKTPPSETEKIYLELAEKLRSAVTIPIAVKAGLRFTNILYLADQLYMRGVAGIVMFNRYYEPDIDISRMEVVPAPVFSTPAEQRYVLRWISMTAAQKIKIDISASTGVETGEDAIRYLLAGATTVQVCSSLYRHGISWLSTMNQQISSWMEKKGFASISDFRGKLGYGNYNDPVAWERSQFMKYFSSED